MALLHRWRLSEATALGLIAAEGAAGRVFAMLVTLFGAGATAWVGARLVATALLAPGDWRRAVAAPSADPAPPQRLSRAAVAAVVAVLTLGAAVVVMADRHLAVFPPEARPVSRTFDLVERIGDGLFQSGTLAALDAARTDALGRSAADLAAITAAVDAGFDAMERNVDPFLDAYYSLPAEYARLIALASGDIAGHLAGDLRAALEVGAPFSAFEATVTAALAREAAAQAGLAAAQARILADNAIPTERAPRAFLVGEGAVDRLAPLPASVRAATTRARTRAGVALGVGVVAGVVVRRIVARGVVTRAAGAVARVLAPRLAAAAAGTVVGGGLGSLVGPLGTGVGGVLGTAAGLGLAVAIGVGTDALMLELDEAMNRAAFRNEIITDITAARMAAHDALIADRP